MLLLILLKSYHTYISVCFFTTVFLGIDRYNPMMGQLLERCLLFGDATGGMTTEPLPGLALSLDRVKTNGMADVSRGKSRVLEVIGR
ncbi:hypothetical protein SAMN02745124_01288 [Desulfofustis glycolicus DSM 9705]|uniref:Uncharacterized protein n=1 Tax=Desulfofustis glycolicus DSM 9705 TaxID=1121409 RepID=A0A1M5UQ10_9BACT|nr:hypothetical protein SAMN02745124_01288 [Desulfofustis glycolicus DSM 9705]